MEIRGVSSLVPARAAVTLQPSVTGADGAATDAVATETATAETGTAGKTGSAAARLPVGIYISPVVHYDQAAKVAVILFRDGDTGETKDQIPAEKVVEQYRRNGGPPNPFPPRSGEDTSSGTPLAAPGAAATSVGSFGGSSGSFGGSSGSRGSAGEGGVSIGAGFLAAASGTGGVQGSSVSSGSGSGGSAGVSSAPAVAGASGSPVAASPARVSVTV